MSGIPKLGKFGFSGIEAIQKNRISVILEIRKIRIPDSPGPQKILICEFFGNAVNPHFWVSEVRKARIFGFPEIQECLNSWIFRTFKNHQMSGFSRKLEIQKVLISEMFDAESLAF